MRVIPSIQDSSNRCNYTPSLSSTFFFFSPIRMGDVDVEEVEEQVVDKYNRGAADLDKVNTFDDGGDDIRGNTLNLENLEDAAPKQKIVTVKPEDLKMIMDELELPKARVESALITNDGDVKATIRSLMGL